MVLGVHVPLRALRTTLKRGVQILKGGVPAREHAQVLKQLHALLPVARPSGHYASRIKVSNRWYSTFVNELRNASRDAAPRIPKYPRHSLIISHAAANPFVSALRPRLVGGAMPRSTSGYSLGGPARHFSHTPTASQVFSHVSALTRAFGIESMRKVDCHQRAGTDWLIGVRAQLLASGKYGGSGAYVDFSLFPNLNYISTLESSELFESLNAGSKSLVTVTTELEKLKMLGNLTITRPGSGDTLRVHFSGCDKEFVENVCEELGVQQGVVHENEIFVFPGIPDYESSESSTSSGSSAYSESVYSECSSDLGSAMFSESPMTSQALKSFEASRSSGALTYLESPAYLEEENFGDDEEIDFYSISDVGYQGDNDSPSDSEPGVVSTLNGSMEAPSQSVYSDYYGSELGLVSGTSDAHSNNSGTSEDIMMMPEVDWGSNHYAGLRSGAPILTPDGSTGTPAQSVCSFNSKPEMITATLDNNIETPDQSI